MDGGGRLLRSLSDAVTDFVPSPLAPPRFAMAGAAAAADERAGRQPPARSRRFARRTFKTRLREAVVAHPRLVGVLFAGGLFAGVGAYGAVLGGQYAAFVAAYGTLPDVIARSLGFGIEAITISGLSEMSETEVLDIAGVRPTGSLAFLDAAAVRARLKAAPMVRDASVTKFFPNRLMVSIVERDPYALWQKDGQVALIGIDGKIIDQRWDDRHDSLPFVTGDKANEHVEDYAKLLAAAGELRPKIRAGVLVAERRWDLVMTSGVLIKLPEADAAAALARLAQIDHDAHILDKDVVSLDLRMPNRIAARLTEEAATIRADVMNRKAGKRGGPT
jgi:cell division protein FtsQ